MTLGKRLKSARISMNLTQKDLAGQLGVKHNTISNWEKDKSMPDPATIEILCNKLHVTPNFMLIGVDNGETLPNLHSDEIAFLKRYRALDDTARGAVIAILDYYYSNTKKQAADRRPAYETPALRVIPGKISRQTVAAGVGTYLEPDSFEDIQVIENSMTKQAAFFVPVSGDSMEPKYYAGDILAVSRSPASLNEVGVFTLDGHGYVKIHGGKKLLSINPNYAPIPMNDDIICNGKVIGVLSPEWIIRQDHN